MDDRKKNILFFSIAAGAIVLSVSVTYIRYVALKDYYVLLRTSCDPAVESCFLYECDPAAEDAECSENPADDAYYYKLIKKKAYAIPKCVNDLEGCPEVTCTQGEKKCTETLCDTSLEESGGTCYGPGLIIPETTENPDESESDQSEPETTPSTSEEGE